MAFNLPTYNQFDCRSEGTNIRWNKWVNRLENIFIAYGINSSEQKKALLLSYAGDELNDIVDSLPPSDTTLVEGEDVYNKLVKAIATHFNPKTNVEIQKYIFRHKVQQSDNINEFYQELHQLAKTCNFMDMESEIKSQLISGCKSAKVREKGLTNPEISLTNLLQFAKTTELAVQFSKQVAGDQLQQLGTHTSKKYKVPTNTKVVKKSICKPRQASICRNCGGKWPHQGGQDKCPAKGKTCRNCGKLNHFAAKCKSTSYSQKPTNTQTRVYCLEDADSSEEFLFSFQTKSNMPRIKLNVLDITINFLIDTGASINVIDEEHYKKFKTLPKLNTSKSVVLTYNNSRINVLGTFETVVSFKQNQVKTLFHVLQGSNGCVLSYQLANSLKLISISDSINTITSEIGKQFPELFQGLGKLKDHQVKLHIDPNVVPVAQKYRRIPFHVRKQLEKQLAQDEAQGVIEKATGPTPWVSPLVVVPKPKSPNEIRVCVDMRMANKAIKRERHATPTLNEIISILSDAKIFSKLDLNQGYNQLELAEESRYITTFSTHVGLFRFKRLNFGVNSASEIFQDTIRQVLNGLDGVLNVSDDILVFSPDQNTHDKHLHAVFQRLKEKGLTLNSSKCEFNKTSINFLGHIFSADGVEPSPDKLKDILNLPIPQNASEVRSLLGMMNFCGSKFIHNYATLTHELRLLTKQGTKFVWESKHEKAFAKLKEHLKNTTPLAYYNQHEETHVFVDASPVGISAILAQPDGNNGYRIIQFASRALTPTEQRYSQTEREALAVIWSCEHLHIYLYGTHFTVHSDHKPLTSIFGNPNAQLGARLERWVLRSQAYDVSVVYRPGKDNPADYLSRHPSKNCESDRELKIAEEYIQYIMENSIPKAMTAEQVASETALDPTLSYVIDCISKGLWFSQTNANFDNKLFEILKLCKEELAVTPNKIILKGRQIVLPKSLQNQAVQLAHSGHQGIVKTLSLLREKVFFYNMHQAVENFIRNCVTCQIAYPSPTREPLSMSPLPDGPWMELSADFGYIPDGSQILVVTDEYSRYVVVEILQNITARTVIPKLDKIFSEFGIPQSIKTDNGPPFSSHEFSAYLNHMGIKHRKITPLWPRANAETERFMRTIKKTIKSAIAQKKCWLQEMYRFLLSYRATPHCTTGKPPAELLFGRNLKTKLPEIIPTYSDQEVRKRDWERKDKMKQYADNKPYIKKNSMKIGDSVFIKDNSFTKLTPYEPKPLTITNKKGSMITAERGNKTITRNSSFFKKSPIPPSQDEEIGEYVDISNTDNDIPGNTGNSSNIPTTNTNMAEHLVTPENTIKPQRPNRNRVPPRKYNDFVMCT